MNEFVHPESSYANEPHGITYGKDDPFTNDLDALRKRGEADGKAAASWFFDGNTSIETYTQVLKGIEDGDPVIMDSLPKPDRSGQWADAPLFEDIAEEVLGEDRLERYAKYEDTGDGESGPHLVKWYELDELTTEYETAFSEAAQFEIERVCNYHLSPDES